LPDLVQGAGLTGATRARKPVYVDLLPPCNAGIMGSGAETAAATAEHLAERGDRVGVVRVRLFRPFPASALLAALPASLPHQREVDSPTPPPNQIGSPA
jgi:hypothetical protein